MGTATLLTAGWHLPVCGRALGHIPGQRWGRGAQLPAGSQPGGRGPPMAPGGPPPRAAGCGHREPPPAHQASLPPATPCTHKPWHFSASALTSPLINEEMQSCLEAPTTPR